MGESSALLFFCAGEKGKEREEKAKQHKLPGMRSSKKKRQLINIRYEHILLKCFTVFPFLSGRGLR